MQSETNQVRLIGENMPTGMLINGQWRKEGYEKDSDGRFLRNPTTFRNWVKADGKVILYQRGDDIIYMFL